MYTNRKVSLVVLFSIVVICILFIGVSDAFAATYTVGPSGYDFTSIQAAINAASSSGGDTIMVFSGTYYENLNVNKNVTVRGVNDGEGFPVVDGSFGSEPVFGLWTNNISIQNMIIQNCYAPGIRIGPFSKDCSVKNNDIFNCYTGVSIEGDRDQVVNNKVHNCNEGIYIPENSDNNVVAYNTILNTIGGNSLNSERSTGNNISYNTIRNGDGIGIMLMYVSGYIVVGNEVSYNNNQGIGAMASHDNNISYNNASYNTYNGIDIWDGSYGYVIIGNTATGNHESGIRVESGCNDFRIIGNDAGSNNNHGIICDRSRYYEIAGNIANGNNQDGIQYWIINDSAVTGNTANNNGEFGIHTGFSENNTVSDNTADNNGRDGLWFDSVTDFDIINNAAGYNQQCGINMRDSHDNNISYNTLAYNTWSGIGGGDNTHDNLFSHNTANNNNGGGICMDSYNNVFSFNTANDNNDRGLGLSGNNLYVYSNTANGNNYGDGICMWGTNNSIIEGNTASNNQYQGISCGGPCVNLTVIGNTVYDGRSGGIILDFPDDCLVAYNDAHNNNGPGVDIRGGTNCNVSYNIAEYNNGDGISMHDDSRNNVIAFNNVGHNNNGGINVGNMCEYIDIFSNTANENYDGINYWGVNNSAVFLNTATNNLNFGIVTGYSENNVVTDNVADYNGRDGLWFDTVTGFEIINNTAGHNQQCGINLRASHDNNISYNTLTYNTQSGIGGGDTLDHNVFTYNTANENNGGGICMNVQDTVFSFNTANHNADGPGLGISGDHIYIYANTANENNNGDGLCVWGMNNSIIEGNTANSNFYNGLSGGFFTNMTVIGNTFNNGHSGGIWLDTPDHCLVAYNEADYNEYSGINSRMATNCNFSYNTMEYNNGGGMGMGDGGRYDILSFNVANNNNGDGINYWDLRDGYIIGNTANNNTNFGLVTGYTTNNTVSGNTADYNGRDGLWFDTVTDFDIINNIAGNNQQCGINMRDSHDNNISYNTLTHNSQSGIGGGDNVRDNLFSHNTANENNGGGICMDSYSNVFSFNTANDNNDRGLGLGGNNLYIYSNTANNNNNGDGICIWGANNTIVEDNVVNGNQNNGISGGNCYNDTVIGNTLNNNNGGIWLDTPDNCLVTSNEIYYTGIWQGIGMRVATNCNISDNTIAFTNADGINLNDNCRYDVIRNNNISKSENTGISINNACDHIDVISNMVKDNRNNGINFNFVNQSNISYNTVEGSVYGISTDNSCDNLLTYNNASYNSQNGINLWNSCKDNTITNNDAWYNENMGFCTGGGSSNNVLTHNTANNNVRFGIWFDMAVSCTVADCSASYNGEGYGGGLSLQSTNDCNIHDNYFGDNLNGIYLSNSADNVLRNNVMENNRYNFADWMGSIVYNDVDTSNLVDGKPIYYLRGVSGITIGASQNPGTVYVMDSNNVVVRDLRIHNETVGIAMFNVSGSSIVNNTITDTMYGAATVSTKGCSIVDNTARDCSVGLLSQMDVDTTITGNDASGNTAGLQVYQCTGNTISSNVLSHNDNFGLFMIDASNVLVEGNEACYNDEHVGYFGNGDIPGTGIWIMGSNNSIRNNNLSYNYEGLLISDSSDPNNPSLSSNNVIENNVLNHNTGLWMNGTALSSGMMVDATGNTIAGNEIAYNDNGIALVRDSTGNGFTRNDIHDNDERGFWVDSSSGNHIFLNDITDNAPNVESSNSTNLWYTPRAAVYQYGGNSYNSSLGNHWSGYGGTDSDGNGVGDSSYTSGGIEDAYPLMGTEDGYTGVVTDPATITVGPSGCDYTSIQAAVDNAINGDIILVNSGTYVENVNVNKAVTLIGVNNGDGIPRIEGSGNTVIQLLSPGTTMENFWINNSGPAQGIASGGRTTIRNNTVTNCQWGIWASGEGNLVTGNTVWSCSGGIIEVVGTNTTITGNNASNNQIGMFVFMSSGTVMDNNIACFNDRHLPTGQPGDQPSTGLMVLGSNGGKFSNNNFSYNILGVAMTSGHGGSPEEDFVTEHNVLQGNTITHNTGIPEDFQFRSCGVLLSSAYNDLIDNDISYNDVGVILAGGYDTRYRYGWNNLTYNTIANNNVYGLNVSGCSNNMIALNDIVGNNNSIVTNASTNVWNTTTPITYHYGSGVYTSYLGNYWSDYTGEDANSDGVGDSSYMHGGIEDTYPLMSTFNDYTDASGIPETPLYDAILVSDTIPSSMASGENLTVTVTMQNSGPAWTQVSGLSTSPYARGACGIAYDEARQEVVLQGGWADSGGYCSDTWVYNGTWTPMPAMSIQRADQAMAYDSDREKVVMFGGDVNGGPTNETWEWDGTDWSLISIPGPSPRDFAEMAYDKARHEMVLFGGTTGYGGDMMNDTWVYDGTSWQRVSVGGPSPRHSVAIAYDPVREKVVLFGGGGWGNPIVNNDTWEWDGSHWSKLDVSFPIPLTQAAMFYDPSLNCMILCGGTNSTGIHGNGETWALKVLYPGENGAGSEPVFNWVKLNVTCQRTSIQAVYDSSRHKGVTFGGRSNFYYLCGETWEWDSSSTWTNANDVTLGVYSTDAALFGSTNVSLPAGATIIPGESYAFKFNLNSPATTGLYDLKYRMQQGGLWFGDTVNRNVTVGYGSYNSSYLSNSIPELAVLGQSYNVSVSLLNTGDTVWTEASKVRLAVWGDNAGFGLTGDCVSESGYAEYAISAGTSVMPGEEYTWNLTMTPSSEGPHWLGFGTIKDSATPQFFGPETYAFPYVWLGTLDSQVVATDGPDLMVLGQAYTANITVRNNGTAVWSEDSKIRMAAWGNNAAFGLNGDCTSEAGYAEYSLPEGTIVYPGEEYTWHFNPVAGSEGPFWIGFGMVKDSATPRFFGPETYAFPYVWLGSLDSQIVSVDSPELPVLYQPYTVNVTMHNDGSAVWTESSKIRLALWGNNDPGLGLNGDCVSESGYVEYSLPSGTVVMPGQDYTWHIDMTPNTEGGYWVGIGMVKDSADPRFFGEQTYAFPYVWMGMPDSLVEVSCPTLPAVYQPMDVTVTATNMGSAVWTEDSHIRLAVWGNDPAGVGLSGDLVGESGYREYVLPSGVKVYPGQSYTWHMNVTPTVQGGYWLGFGMVKDSSSPWFFGSQPYAFPYVWLGMPDQSYVSDTIPGSMTAGNTYHASITFRNTGSAVWTEDTKMRLAIWGNNADFGLNGDCTSEAGYAEYTITPGTYVQPGQEYTWTFDMTPATTGSYWLGLSPMQDKASPWFYGPVTYKSPTVG